VSDKVVFEAGLINWKEKDDFSTFFKRHKGCQALPVRVTIEVTT
jgi:hypothetical protein